MLFQRPNGGHLKVVTQALQQMVPYLQHKSVDCEAGGILLGRLLRDSNDIVVDEVTIPMPGDKRNRYAFYRAKRRHQEIINQRWQESSGTCIYLGEWHTHPERIPTPSTIDLKDWQRKLKTDTFENDLFFLILGIEEARMWTGKQKSHEMRPMINIYQNNPDYDRKLT
ncbi:hypothetical protein DUE52_03095 [Larkinella punicea]|uniref:JAB domain-containing protein n=1 Tax=Larkinella punicea TaxID=2315727 RepID=A0A368JUK3_9BACT|nr:hypothetical protein DUE52_03095 [Larkinella punicea]